MKKHEIKAALEALKKIKMPKLDDKDLRNTIIKNHLYLLGQQKKYEQDIEDMRTAHLGPYDEETQKVQELQQKLQVETDRVKAKEIADEINSYKEFFEAVAAFNKAADEKGKEEVEITLISADKFTEEYMKQDYDCSVVEALYPMFDIE